MSKQIIQISDKKAYADTIGPYLEPNGLVDVWSSVKGGKWKRLKFQHIRPWIERNNNIDIFYTVQQYRIHPKTFEDLQQEPFYAPLYFDFDGDIEDEGKGADQALSEAKDDVISLCSMFVNVLGLDQTVLRIWYSGSKGFHVTIDGRIFGITPNPRLHLLYKNVAYYYAQFLDLKTLDLRVYSYRRQWRIPNSKRSKKVMLRGEEVDQYKVELSFSELSCMSIDDIREKAMNPSEPLFEEDEYKDINPSDDAISWLNEFIIQFRTEEKLLDSRARKKIVVPDDMIGQEPSCIKAIREYGFAEDKRNQALVVLTTFFKDIGIEHTQAETELIAWTESIPWGEGKTKERISNAKGVVKRVYDTDESEEGNIYRFTCQYVRALAGQHYNGNKVVIPCHFEQCKFVKDVTDQMQEKVIEGSLIDVQKAEFFMKRIRCLANVIGFGDRAYSIPLRVKISCCHIESNPETQDEKTCPQCKMTILADNKIAERRIDEPYIRTMAIDVLRRGLDFTNVTNSQKRNLIRALAGIPRECRAWSYEEEAKGTLRELILRSTVASDNYVTWSETKRKDVEKQNAFIVHSEDDEFFMDANIDVEIIGVPVNSPKDQSIYFAIMQINTGHSELDNFEMTKELLDELKNHQVQEGSNVWDTLMKRAEYMMKNVTHIRERPFLHTAVDLVYHCPPFLKLHENDNQERGMMQLLVVGDPGQGKTWTPKLMMHHYRLGNFIEGSGSGRTGLLYTIDLSGKNRILRWGAMPQQDMRLLIIDETNQIPSKDLEQMTGPRTNGILDVRRAISATTFARVRLIFMANPKSTSCRLESFGYGADAITSIFPKQQDVRRLDLTMLVRSGEVDIGEINKIDEVIDRDNKVYSSASCHNLLLWAWTRHPENIIWGKKTLDRLFELSTELSDRFECDMSIAQAQDMRYRLARIAQSVAALVFSTDKDGEKLYVKVPHVEVAAEFFNRCMTDIGQMYLDMYSVVWKNRNYMKAEEEEDLRRLFLGNEWFADWAEFMLSVETFAKKNVIECCDINPELFQEMWKFLISKGMVKVKDKFGYEKTPKFTNWLRSRLNTIMFKPILDIKRSDR